MKKQNKRLLWVAVAAIIVVAIIVALQSGWRFVKKDLAKQPQEKSTVKPLLKDELRRLIIAASDSLYDIHFSDFVLNIDSGKGFIKDIKLTGDSNIYRRLIAAHKAPDM